MKIISKILFAFSFILILLVCLIVYKQQTEITKIQKKTLELEKQIDINHSNNSFGSFNNSFNNGDINDKVLNSEKEIEDLKEDLESTKSDLEDTKSELEETKENQNEQ